MEINPYQSPSSDEHSHGHDADDGACPLCGTLKHMRKRQPLYGRMVCKKCFYGFANRRQIAFIVDILAWRFMTVPIGVAINMSVQQSELQIVSLPAFAVFMILLDWVLLPICFSCKDCFSGHSPGKFLCGVRVIDNVSGEPGGFVMSLKRNLPLIIPVLPLIVAYQMTKGHRIGDQWSRSKVVWKKHASHPIFAPDLA